MEKRSKLGLAVTSLAVAGTMVGAGTAHAGIEECSPDTVGCSGNPDGTQVAYLKVDAALGEVLYKFEGDAMYKFLAVQFADVLYKLSDPFIKID